MADRTANTCQTVKVELVYLISASPNDIRNTEPTIRATPSA
jgi:hypothetical protein